MPVKSAAPPYSLSGSEVTDKLSSLCWCSKDRVRIHGIFGRMLNDVPVFGELAITHSENLADNYGRSIFGRREAYMKKHHVAFRYGSHDLPFRLWRRLDQVSEESDGGL